jgi:hypothetical protein
MSLIYSNENDLIRWKRLNENDWIISIRVIKSWKFVCLFVCLFNSYTVPLFRENMRGVIYSGFSCHLYTIKEQEDDDRLNFKSSKTISLKLLVSNRESDYFIQSCHLWSFHIRLVVSFLICIRFVAFVSSNDLCRSQNDQVFCQMISKRSSLFRSNFLNFISLLKFLFRAQFVHAKTTLSCDRRYYKRRDDDRWWWSTNDVTFCLFLRAKVLSYFSISWLDLLVFVEFLCLVYRDHHFLSVSLKLLCDLSLKTVCSERFHALLRMLCLLLSIVLHRCLSREIDVVVVCLSFVEMCLITGLLSNNQMWVDQNWSIKMSLTEMTVIWTIIQKYCHAESKTIWMWEIYSQTNKTTRNKLIIIMIAS